MPTLYCLVEEGKEILWEQPLPLNWRNISGLSLLPDDHLAKLGWLPADVERPPLWAYQQYGTPTYQVVDGRVKVVYPVVDLPEAEVKRQKREEAQADLDRIDHRSIRSIREWLAAREDAPQFVKDHEIASQQQRQKLRDNQAE